MDAILAALDALNERTATQAPAAPPVPAPQNAKPAAPQPPPAAQPLPKAPKMPPEPHAGTGALQGMFEDGNTLLRAVIASEVLGPPASLRENHFWNQQPNEPST